MIIFLFSSKAFVETPHLNRLIEMVQMRGHNICLCRNITKCSLLSESALFVKAYLSKILREFLQTLRYIF